jgi:hypothetical protein
MQHSDRSTNDFWADTQKRLTYLRRLQQRMQLWSQLHHPLNPCCSALAVGCATQVLKEFVMARPLASRPASCWALPHAPPDGWSDTIRL